MLCDCNEYYISYKPLYAISAKSEKSIIGLVNHNSVVNTHIYTPNCAFPPPKHEKSALGTRLYLCVNVGFPSTSLWSSELNWLILISNSTIISILGFRFTTPTRALILPIFARLFWFYNFFQFPLIRFAFTSLKKVPCKCNILYGLLVKQVLLVLLFKKKKRRTSIIQTRRFYSPLINVALLCAEPEAPWGDGISSTARGTLLCTNESCSGRSQRCGSWVLLVRLSWVLLEEILWYGFILKNVFRLFLIVIGTKFQQSLFILIHSAGVCQSTLQLTLGSRSDSTQTPNAVIGRYLTKSSNKVLVKWLIFNLIVFVKYFQKARESSNKVAGRACVLYRVCTLRWFSSPSISGH